MVIFVQSALRAQLLGTPKVWLEDTIITFPFKQAEALFYYLLSEGEASRDAIADTIWETSSDPDKALASMRNAIYVLRKQFGRDIIVEPAKGRLSINPELRPTCDIDVLYGEEMLPIDIYQGHFLERFYLKKSPLFNEWVDNCQQQFLQRFISRCSAQIKTCCQEKNYKRCELLCLELMRVDSYEDTAYYALMECYRAQGQHRKAIAIYEKMEALYQEELFEQPGQRIQELACIIRAEASTWTRSTEDTFGFFGRKEECAQVYSAIERCFTGGKTTAFLLRGEAGIGKTRLMEEVGRTISQRDDVLFLKSACFQAESKYALRPWQSILHLLREQCGNGENESTIETMLPLKYIDAETELTALLIKLGKKKYIVISFDDMQWADEATVALIRRLSADQRFCILFVLLLQDGTERFPFFENFISHMQYSGKLIEQTLQRFDLLTTTQMLHSLLDGITLTQQEEKQFYWETEGNPFFIVALATGIKNDGAMRDISPSIRELIKIRISMLPPQYPPLLELLSLFYSGISFEMLKELSQKDELELLSELDFLVERAFLIEATAGRQSVYQFTHHKIPEYIYSAMSQAKKRVFHRKAANYYEEQIKMDGGFDLYPALIHHYERAGMEDKSLEYTLRYLNAYLGLAHEYFPIVNPSLLSKRELPNQPLSEIHDLGMDITIDEVLSSVERFAGKHGNVVRLDNRIRQLTSQSYLLVARYYIQDCRYEDGLKYIYKLKQINRSTEDREQVNNLLGAYKLQLYISINRHQIRTMPGILSEAFALLLLIDDPTEVAVWTRLRGMCHVMGGRMEKATADLQQALRLFHSSTVPTFFLYNQAAAYTWLGEIHRNLFDQVTADEYYRKAIKICGSYYWIGSVALFYTYAGMNAYDSGNEELARTYLQQAMDNYSKSTFFWGRGLAHGYWSLLLAEDDFSQAVDVLREAERCAQIFGNQFEMGVVTRIKAQFRFEMESGTLKSEEFDSFLTESADTYIAQAQTMLQGIFSPVDALYLSQLRQKQDSLSAALDDT